MHACSHSAKQGRADSVPVACQAPALTSAGAATVPARTSDIEPGALRCIRPLRINIQLGTFRPSVHRLLRRAASQAPPICPVWVRRVSPAVDGYLEVSPQQEQGKKKKTENRVSEARME